MLNISHIQLPSLLVHTVFFLCKKKEIFEEEKKTNLD